MTSTEMSGFFHNFRSTHDQYLKRCVAVWYSSKLFNGMTYFFILFFFFISPNIGLKKSPLLGRDTLAKYWWPPRRICLHMWRRCSLKEGHSLQSGCPFQVTRTSALWPCEQTGFCYTHLYLYLNMVGVFLTLCLVTRIQKIPRLLVAAADGYLYLYNLDPQEGGECTLMKQHK